MNYHEKILETNDLKLAAYIRARGLRITSIDFFDPMGVIFRFYDWDVSDQLVKEYEKGELLVGYEEHSRQVRELKARIKFELDEEQY